mmetsp:Transcript_30613/g.67229  ORF Transcript_30613/g.67229 Transcript_30613/m.67229 type:complete len:200 (+) Transcript_30613:342-941(+)
MTRKTPGVLCALKLVQDFADTVVQEPQLAARSLTRNLAGLLTSWALGWYHLLGHRVVDGLEDLKRNRAVTVARALTAPLSAENKSFHLIHRWSGTPTTGRLVLVSVRAAVVGYVVSCCGRMTPKQVLDNAPRNRGQIACPRLCTTGSRLAHGLQLGALTTHISRSPSAISVVLWLGCRLCHTALTGHPDFPGTNPSPRG